jgi:hypothetical protein
MNKPGIGRKPPRYKFLLNPHDSLRLSSCPTCRKQTFPRKFALFIHVEGWGPYTQGKTCKYCARCEMIMCQQSELEAQLAHAFQRLKPDVIGSEYLVIGTVDLKTWKEGVAGKPHSLEDAIEQLSDFKKHTSLDLDPGGWRPEGADPSRYVIRHADAAKELVTSWRRHEG